VTAGVLSHPASKPTLKLAVREREHDWWRRFWEKISSPFPNCNVVENQPASPLETNSKISSDYMDSVKAMVNEFVASLLQSSQECFQNVAFDLGTP
jgi:hypothetical protein